MKRLTLIEILERKTNCSKLFSFQNHLFRTDVIVSETSNKTLKVSTKEERFLRIDPNDSDSYGQKFNQTALYHLLRSHRVSCARLLKVVLYSISSGWLNEYNPTPASSFLCSII